jgi:hypothetical protein
MKKQFQNQRYSLEQTMHIIIILIKVYIAYTWQFVIDLYRWSEPR